MATDQIGESPDVAHYTMVRQTGARTGGLLVLSPAVTG
jgi:hypothetical protein